MSALSGSGHMITSFGPGRLRFGVCELDIASRELRRRGRLVQLQQQPMSVLIYFVQHAGEVVSREDLRQALWPSGTFVEFEVGIYAAVNRLRRALGDSASEPQFIETVPTIGYRWIAPVLAADPEEQSILSVDDTSSLHKSSLHKTSDDAVEISADDESVAAHPPARRFQHLPIWIGLALSVFLFTSAIVLLQRAYQMRASARPQVYRFYNRPVARREGGFSGDLSRRGSNCLRRRITGNARALPALPG